MSTTKLTTAALTAGLVLVGCGDADTAVDDDTGLDGTAQQQVADPAPVEAFTAAPEHVQQLEQEFSALAARATDAQLKNVVTVGCRALDDGGDIQDVEAALQQLALGPSYAEPVAQFLTDEVCPT